MKFRVESTLARTVSWDNFPPDLHQPEEILLDFSVESQRQSQWCWSAIAVSLAQFYSTGLLSQSELVKKMMALSDDNPSKNSKNVSDYNQPAVLEHALRFMGCYGHWNPGRASLERLYLALIEQSLPCVRVEWPKGGAHFLVIKGVNIKTQSLWIEDPLYGPSEQAYDQFPKQYIHAQGVWSETYWTTANADCENTDSGQALNYSLVLHNQKESEFNE
ncbi:MAG: hypothetical protein OXE99_10015 [Cellvibrionales bacterium]|nr:hypothetical protein [Cellvibrionales bacterium]